MPSMTFEFTGSGGLFVYTVEVWKISEETKFWDFSVNDPETLETDSNIEFRVFDDSFQNDRFIVGFDIDAQIENAYFGEIEFTKDSSGDFWRSNPLIDRLGTNYLTDIVVTPITEEYPDSFSMLIDDSAPIEIRAEHWEVSGSEKKDDLPLGVEFPIGSSDPVQQIRLFPLDGFEISSVYVGGDLSASSYGRASFTLDSSGDYWYLNMDEVVWLAHSSNLMTVEVTTIEETTVISPFNRIHLLNSEQVRKLSNVSMEPIEVIDGGDWVGYNKSAYIINLITFPFKIPTELIGSDLEIKLGAFTSNILTPLILTDLFTIDLGTIEVVGLFGNSADYLDSEYELFLPLVNTTFKMEPSQVVNKEISCEYVIDAYSGSITINIYNKDSENPIVSSTSMIGREIPIKTMTTVEGVIGTSNGSDNNVFSAFIRMTQSETVDGIFNNIVFKTGIIGNYVGYVKVEEMQLESDILLDEQMMIMDSLRSGVIIK